MAVLSAAADPAQRQRPWIVVTLLVYALIQLLYITATPLQTITLPDNLPQSAGASQSVLTGIGPDEKEYLVYVMSMAERGRIPAPSPRYRTSPDEYVSYQAQHPPLFFALLAPIYKLTTAAAGPAAFWYIARILCAAFGGIAIWLIARAAAVAFPDRPLVYLAAAPLTAFTPMFGHMTANLSNEPLAMALTAAAWLQMGRMVRAVSPPVRRQAVLLGVTLGLAALTRLTALMWLPAAVLVILWSAKARRGEGSASGVSLLMAFAIPFALLAGSWLVRNQIVFGTPVLRTFDRPLLAYGSFADFLGRGIHPPNAPMLVNPRATALWYASTAWWPYWLIQFYLPGFPPAGPAWQALFLIVDVVLGLLLFLHSSRSRQPGKGDSDAAGRILLWSAGATLAFCLLSLLQQQFWSDWNVVNSPGRYIVAAAPATTTLILFALSTPVRLQGKESAQRAAAVGVTVALLVFDLATALLVRRFYTDNPAQSAVQPIPEARTMRPVSEFAAL